MVNYSKQTNKQHHHHHEAIIIIIIIIKATKLKYFSRSNAFNIVTIITQLQRDVMSQKMRAYMILFSSVPTRKSVLSQRKWEKEKEWEHKSILIKIRWMCEKIKKSKKLKTQVNHNRMCAIARPRSDISFLRLFSQCFLITCILRTNDRIKSNKFH